MIGTFKKYGSGLFAGDDPAERILEAIAQDEEVLVTISKPRSIQHHKLYYALCTLVASNSSLFMTKDEVSDHLKLNTGLYETMYVGDDQVPVHIPRSIAFENMSTAEFREYWERVCDYVAVEIIPGIDREDMMDEINRMIQSGVTQP